MRIQVNGKHIDVGESLTGHVEEKLLEVVQKYAERPIEAIVTFSKDRYEFVADATVHLSTGLTTKAHGRAADVYDSFDGALARMEKQLRRYKRRLKDHQSGPKADLPAAESTPVLVLRSDRRAVEVPEDELEEDDGGAVGGD